MRHADSKILFFILTLSLAVSCKKVTVGKGGTSGGAGGGGGGAGGASGESLALLDESMAAAEEQEAAEEADGGEEIAEEGGAEGEPTLDQRFNFAKWIKTRQKMEPMFKFIEPGNTMFFMGEKEKFRIETNGAFGVSPDFDKGAAERKLEGKYWLKAYALGQHLKPKDDELGLFLDVGAEAVLDKLSIEMWFRVVGDDIAARSVLAGFDQAIVRETGFGASAIPGVSGELAMGGELGLRTEFGIRRDNALNLVYTPRASIHVKAAVLVGAKDIAATGIKGTLRVAELKLKGSANLGYHEGTKFLYYDYGLDPGELRLLEGRIYYVVAQVLGKELGTIDIWKPAPVGIFKTPGFSGAFIKFLSEPATSSACLTATHEVGKFLAESIRKQSSYLEEAPDEDKPMMKHAMARTGMVFKKVQEYCGQ